MYNLLSLVIVIRMFFSLILLSRTLSNGSIYFCWKRLLYEKDFVWIKLKNDNNFIRWLQKYFNDILQSTRTTTANENYSEELR